MARVGQALTPFLFGAAALSLFVPGVLDFALGIVFLAGAGKGWWAVARRPVEAEGWGPLHPAVLLGLFGLFGGGAVAWGWLPAAQAAAGVAGLVFLAANATREHRDADEVGCGLTLGAFAATGLIGLFWAGAEKAGWPGTPAGRSATGVGSYLLVWLAGAVLVGASLAAARRRAAGGQPAGWAVVLAAAGFGAWAGGALYVRESW